MRHKQDQGGTQLIPPAGALQKCSRKATKPGAEQAWTGREIPDVWGGLRGCPVVKLRWSCPAGSKGYEGTECVLLIQALGDLQVQTG